MNEMRRWYIGINDHYYTSHICLEEASWYIFALENSIMTICDYAPRIPFPKIKIKRDEEETNLKDWYGDTQQVFHAFVCDSVFQWCQKRIKNTDISLPFFYLKTKFPDEFKDCSYEDSVKVRKFHSELLSQVIKDLMKNDAKDAELAIKTFCECRKQQT